MTLKSKEHGLSYYCGPNERLADPTIHAQKPSRPSRPSPRLDLPRQLTLPSHPTHFRDNAPGAFLPAQSRRRQFDGRPTVRTRLPSRGDPHQQPDRSSGSAAPRFPALGRTAGRGRGGCRSLLLDLIYTAIGYDILRKDSKYGRIR